MRKRITKKTMLDMKYQHASNPFFATIVREKELDTDFYAYFTVAEPGRSVCVRLDRIRGTQSIVNKESGLPQ